MIFSKYRLGFNASVFDSECKYGKLLKVMLNLITISFLWLVSRLNVLVLYIAWLKKNITITFYWDHGCWCICHLPPLGDTGQSYFSHQWYRKLLISNNLKTHDLGCGKNSCTQYPNAILYEAKYFLKERVIIQI